MPAEARGARGGVLVSDDGFARVLAREVSGRGGNVLPDRSLAGGVTPVPGVRPGWVARPRLVERLLAAAGVRLVVIAAPGGYGKSTLLAQWRADARERRALAWLSLDGLDNDPVRLWTRILAAVGQAGAGVAVDDLCAMTRVQSPDLAGVVLPRLLERLGRVSRPVVLVLDDVHLLTATVGWAQVEALLDGLRPGHQLVLSSRHRPMLPLARLRAGGDLVELGPDELRFSAAQVRALPDVAAVALTDEQVEDLTVRTEGWPAAVYLAALSLRGHIGDPAAFLASFAGDNRHISDYLAEEVLAGCSPQVRRFLLRTCGLDAFTAALAAHMCGVEVSEAEEMLAELAAGNLFVIALDERRQWYRYHHLFGQCLRALLTRTDPDLPVRLHRRAEAWLAGHGHVEAAIGHAVAAGDSPTAAALLARSWLGYVTTGRTATLTSLIETIGDEAIGRDTPAAVSAAWAGAVTGDLPGAIAWLDVAENLGWDGPLPDGTRSLKSAAALLRGTFLTDDLAQRLAESRLAAELEDDPSSPWYVMARFSHGVNLYLTRRHDQALRVLEQASRSRAGTSLFQIIAMAMQSLACTALGRHDQAAALAAVCRSQVEEHHLAGSAQASFAYTAHATCLTQRGELAAARHELDHAAALRTRAPGLSRWPALMNVAALARWHLATGDHAAARAACDQADDLLAGLADGGYLSEQVHDLRQAIRATGATPAPAGPPPAPRPYALTRQERVVLGLLATSLSISQIAAELQLSVNTVRTHVRTVYRKLAVSSRQAAVERARDHKLLPDRAVRPVGGPQGPDRSRGSGR